MLREAKQKIPPFLAAMQSENEKYLDIGGEKKTPNKCGHCLSVIFTFIISLWWQYWCFNTLWFGVVGEVGCSYCGGLGHRIADCPKLEAIQTKQAQNIGRRDYLAHSSADYWTVHQTNHALSIESTKKSKQNGNSVMGMMNVPLQCAFLILIQNIAIPLFWITVDFQGILEHILCSICEEDTE